MGRITEGVSPLSVMANDRPRRESWWACEDGRWHHFDTRSARLYNQVDPDDSFESRRFFFQRLQMVKRSLERGKLTLKWHVKHVSPSALGAALVFLDERASKGKPVQLVFNHGGWHRDECATPRAAIDRIMRLPSGLRRR